MSATVDVDKFSSYWQCPVLYVEGRQFPVSVCHVSQPTDDYQRALLSTVFHIHSTAPPQQDILAFLTGQEEIEAVARQVGQETNISVFIFNASLLGKSSE